MESHASASTSAHPPADYELGDVDALEEDEPMVDATTGQKILRPRNAWILYRKTRLDDVPLLPDGSKQPMAKASSVIAHWWKTESKDVRRKFELMAAAEKAEHKRRYPDYKYKPRTPHQIALAKEKKKVAKKLQAAKEKDKKAKAADSAPPPLTSMAHTSYVEAALANQAARRTSSTHGPGGPSPPMSLASTPVNTPSPLPLSDFEQGSSSTAATSHQTPSPGDMLGLSLAPPSFNFSESKPSLRAPRHIPARLPPRARAKRQVSGISTTGGSRVPSSSSLVLLSPATSTPTSLSPLAWPPTSQYPSPQSGDEPLSSDLVPRHDCELFWGGEPSGIANTEGGSVSIDLQDFNPTSSGDIMDDLTYFSMNFAMPENNEGVFQMPAAPFIDAAPEHVNVSLMNGDQSDQDRQRFEAILDDFDFSSFQSAAETTFDPSLSEDHSMSDASAWEQWTTMQQPQPSPAQEDSGAANGYTVPAPSLPQEQPTQLQYPNTKYETEQPVSPSVDMQHPQSHEQEDAAQGHPAIPFSPEVLADPEFQAMFAGYLERKQKRTQQPAQYMSPEHSEEVHHAQSHYPQHSVQQHQQYQSQHKQQVQYDSSNYEGHHHRAHTQTVHHTHAGTDHVPSAPSVHTPAAQTNRWVPPPGAMHSGTRRVAGSWRPPPSVQQEDWPVSQSPVDYAPGSRLPPWAGVTN